MFGVIGDIIGGITGRKNNKSTNRANLTAVRETNATNRQIAESANALSQHQMDLAYQRDTAAVREARQWDQRQVVHARNWDAAQVQAERRWNQSVANLADTRDRNRFLQDRAYSEQQARLAEGRDRANFLENRQFETDQFLENREYTAEQALAAEQRQREYQAADLADARAYADPAAERARLEAAGFNPLGRADSSSGMNNIGGAIANAPAALAPPSGYVSPGARAAADMGMSGSPVPAGAGSAASQIARSQMAKFGVFDPAVAHMTAPQLTADNSLGEGIADAFQSIEAAQIQEKEYALRKTQAEIEERRLSELMQRATMRPIVGGVYSREVGIGRESALAAGGSSSPRSPRDSAGIGGSAYGYSGQKGIRPAGLPLDVERKNSDAQQIEDRYGEIAGSLIGLGNFASDAGKTVNKWWNNGGGDKVAKRAKEMASFGALSVRNQRDVGNGLSKLQADEKRRDEIWNRRNRSNGASARW